MIELHMNIIDILYVSRITQELSITMKI